MGIMYIPKYLFESLINLMIFERKVYRSCDEIKFNTNFFLSDWF